MAQFDSVFNAMLPEMFEALAEQVIWTKIRGGVFDPATCAVSGATTTELTISILTSGAGENSEALTLVRTCYFYTQAALEPGDTITLLGHVFTVSTVSEINESFRYCEMNR